MLLVGLTGGIGAGKSTVGDMLGEHGAVILDADTFARQALDPGTPGHRRVVEAFGPGVVASDGAIDRGALARRVFTDRAARERLEAIVHPEVARRFQDAVEPYRGTDRIVVYVVPLLVENRLQSMFDVVAVVTAPRDVRIQRSVARGMVEDDAEARAGSQSSDAGRERAADVVIRNDGTLEDLAGEVDALWSALVARGSAGPETGSSN